MSGPNDNRDELLEMIPAYRRGELSPAQAHRISLLLEEDARFAQEAEREEALVEALTTMKEIPLPRGLVARSVKFAVGNTSTSSWISLDTLLIALGVGIACAATAQFLSGRVNILPTIGEWIGSLAGVAVVDSTMGGVLGTVGLISLGAVVAGAVWAIRAFRSSE